MSTVTSRTDEPAAEPTAGLPHQPVHRDPVVVRRNAGLAALVGGGASAIAIAYLWRASGSGALVDWALCATMAVLGALFLAQLVDARTALLVADDLGVRVRFGRQWRGLPWDAVEAVVVRPRRGPFHDGRLTFAPYSLARALDGLDSRGRRAARVNQQLYGAALAVPLGLSTRASVRASRLADALAALVQGRAEVLVLAASGTGSAETGPGTLSERAERLAVAEALETSSQVSPELGSAVHVDAGVRLPAASALPAAGNPPVTRVPVTYAPAATLGNAALLADPDETSQVRALDLPESLELRRPAYGDTVRPLTTLPDPVGPLVVRDYVTEPAYDPVIGSELAAARHRTGLSVDELSERTRIRPHVIEAIEVDDFAPCGGDFYARGHLRTLARVLGRDPATLLALYDSRYASAPVNARRVFEAELATGMTGSVRRTSAGGPHWALLVGVVLALIMVWSVIRLVASDPQETLQPTVPVLDGSSAVARTAAGGSRGAVAATARPVAVRVGAVGSGTEVVVRDRTAKVVWAGRLAAGQVHALRVAPPVRISAQDGGAVRVSVKGVGRGLLGATGASASRTFTAPGA